MSGWSGPPGARSREACAFSAFAAAGRLRLQRCSHCGRFTWPARDACPACWFDALVWADAPESGTLVADSVLHHSFSAWFAERLPWRMGLVQAEAGPQALAHVHESAKAGGHVRLLARTDASGQGVLIALSETGESTMTDDPKLHQLTCDPAGRTILITDVTTTAGQAVAEALLKAGAARVYGGHAGNKPPDRTQVDPIWLDPADPESVSAQAGSLGDVLDLIVHSGGGAWPGGALGQTGIGDAEDEMAINYFGPLRLVRAFAPGLRDRKTGSSGPMRAWVNLLSAHALCGATGFGTSAASQAAALSLSQALRSDLVGSGVRVVDVFTGPLESAGATAPAPRVRPAELGAAVVEALQQGLERIAVGSVARDMLNSFEESPMALEREALRP